MPRVNFKKEGLFDPSQPLFPDMIAGNYEEWMVYNSRSRVKDSLEGSRDRTLRAFADRSR